MRKHNATIIEWVYLIGLFIVGRLPMRDFDIWFHLKSGELFVSQGHLQFTEVFSYAAYGRPWYPYEWLFQVTTYLLSRIGLWTLPLFIGLFIIMMQWVFLRILRDVFQVPLIGRLILSFIFFVSIYEYHTIRPHVLAYSFVAVILLFIFERMYCGKRWILLSPLVTLIWTNLHSSSFLAWGLPLAYLFIVCIWWFVEKKHEYIGIIQDLGYVAIANAVITILPPLGFSDYRLLWEFFADRVFISRFIGEWGPISDIQYGFYVYSTVLILSLCAFLWATYKKRSWLHALFAIPLMIMTMTPYAASRNVVLGMLGMLIILGSTLPTLSTIQTKRIMLYMWTILACICVTYYGVTLIEKTHEFASERLYFPVQATAFAKKYLKGNMFNDYAYGGYIEYNMYPKQKVFFDGRADVFHTREMRDYFQLSLNKELDNTAYKKIMDNLWNTYSISYIIAPTRKHNVWRKVTSILSTDPQWALVFWDDDSQIFVRRDGKNDEIISKLGAKAATPYLRDPFDKNKIEQALFEYTRMDQIAKSARTSNAIGYIVGQSGKTDESKKRFTEATHLDPTFESPYMNLAELAAHEGNIDTAIQLYGAALKEAPDRGLIYIRMGQLYLTAYPTDRQRVKKLWENGLKNTIDEDAKKKLHSLLETL